jgi:hypothetical protein
MFLIDSIMISGIKWALETVVTAAEAEMHDDTAVREQLLAAEMRRELGEISDDEFRDIEADLLARLREIKERRDGTEPLGLASRTPIEAADGSRFTVDAEVLGDFHGHVVDGSDRAHRADRSDRPDRPDRVAADGTTRAPRTTRTTRTPRTKRS